MQATACAVSHSIKGGSARLHADLEWPHRGWNLHPDGSANGSGTVPGMEAKRSCSSSSDGMLASNP
jgi:hypothetical protein